MTRTIFRGALLGMLTCLPAWLTGCEQAVAIRQTPVDDVGADQDTPTRRPNFRIDMFNVQVVPEGKLRATGRVLNDGLRRSRKRANVKFFLVGKEDGDEKELPIVRVLSDAAQGIDQGGSHARIRQGRSRFFDVLLNSNELPAERGLKIEARADADGGIEESNEKDNSAQGSVDYGADLALIKLEKKEDPSNPDVIELRAEVANLGTLNSGDVKAALMVHVPPNPPTPTPGQDDKASDPAQAPADSPNAPPAENKDPEANVSAQANKEFTFVDSKAVKVLKTGKDTTLLEFTLKKPAGSGGKELEARVILDPGEGGLPNPEGLPELDKKNNLAAIEHTFPAEKPDLQVWGLLAYWNPRGNDIKLRSLIRNTGRGDAPAFQSQWSQSPLPTPTTRIALRPLGAPIAYPAIPAKTTLGFGQSPDFTWIPSDSQEGKFTFLRFEADAGNQLDEESDIRIPMAPPPSPPVITNDPGQAPASPSPSAAGVSPLPPLPRSFNAGNNLMSWVFKVPRRQRPDLRVVRLEAEVIEKGKFLRVAAQVRNVGEVASPAAKGQWVVGGKEVDSFPLATLRPSVRSPIFGRVFPITKADRERGSIEISFRANPGGDDRELANNLRATKTAVPGLEKLGPDVTIDDPVLAARRSQPNLKYPDQLVVKAMVKNQGDEPTGPIVLTTGIRPEGRGQTFQFKDLAPGKSTPVEWSYRLTERDYGKNILARFEVACKGEKTPLSRTNNVAESDPIELPALELADVVVENILMDNSSLAKGVVRFKAVVKNEGWRSAAAIRVNWRINGFEVERKVEESTVPRLAAQGFAGNDEYSTRAVNLEYKLKNTDPRTSLSVMVGLETQTAESDDQNNYSEKQFNLLEKPGQTQTE